MNEQVFNEVDRYISGLFTDGGPELRSATAAIEQNEIVDMSISPVQGQLLQVLMKACNARNVLEVGTLGGYSTIWLAKALPEGGKVVTIESEVKHAEVAKLNIRNAGVENKVEVLVGKALDVMPTLPIDKPFDFIFIDADKLPYTEYFKLALQLSKKGTMIICDNVIRAGRVMDNTNMDEKVQGVRRFNEYLSTCEEVTATILQTVGSKEHDGMAIAVVK